MEAISMVPCIAAVWGGRVITDIRKWSRSSDSCSYCLWRCSGLLLVSALRLFDTDICYSLLLPQQKGEGTSFYVGFKMLALAFANRNMRKMECA